MYNVKLYNKISKVGLDDLDPAKYTCAEDFTDYDAVLVRSAKLHDVEFPKNLRCIARAGAGVNNIPIDRCSEEGIVVFNTPGANANAVKELVICALLLASRKVVQGANWVKGLKGTPDIGPAAEKGKSTYAGPEIAGKKLGIVPILRAGLGMVDGVMRLVPAARVGHIGLYRDPETHMPVEYYCKLPTDVAERDLIVVDPMLATGGSSIAAINFIKKRGCKSITLMCLVGCPEGVKALQEAHPDVNLYIAAIDEKLNESKYIIPGLGDAGDRLFGTK